MQERGPDISNMIQEELDKAPAAESQADQPLNPEEFESVETAVDKAFDDITLGGAETGTETEQATAIAEMGAKTAREITGALTKGDKAGLAKALESYKADGGDVAVLKEQLQTFHDAYQSLNPEQAAEIDAFARSLEASSEVSTSGGKEFMAKLESDDFGSLEEAINALDGLKDQAKGMDPEALAGLNNEFNLLFAAAQEKFMGQQQEANQEGGPDFGDIDDDEMDDMFSALG